jgi:riboflavin kinase/FMN adenylyltransferase
MSGLFRRLDDLPERCLGGAVSIGNFDGVHLGHKRILSCLVERATQIRQATQVACPAIVMTFDPHPARLLRPSQAPWPLTWTERKAQLLCTAGVDAVVAYPTDAALLTMTAQEFFEQIVVRKLKAKAMVEGPDFFFGHDRQGDIALLRQLCQSSGIALEVVQTAEFEGTVVSSSRIRALISAGQVERAGELMGRPYRIRGIVEHGEGRGNGLGYPTANVGKIELLVPGEGIYAGTVWIDGTPYATAMSVGGNPTFGENVFKVEAFVLDYDGNLYERPIEIDFLARLRDIMKFDSADQLVAQMALDVEQTRQIYKENYEAIS